MQNHRQNIDTNHRAMETAGIHAANWVVGKALTSLSGGLLEAWAASTKLGSNIEALKTELTHVKGILNLAQYEEIHNPPLVELLDNLRHLAYGADDVLDELDYFRIQDELDNTYHAADTHAAGCVQDLVLNARHTARACVNKLKFPACKSAPSQDGGDKQGCLSGLRSCGRREIRSSPLSPSNQLGVQDVHGGCLPKAAHTVGKHFSCFSLLPSVTHDAQRAVVGNPNTTEENGLLEIPKLKFDRVGMSKRHLAYGADDVLDELDYFRIQDELDNTYHAADTHAAGCVQDLVLNARHTARACVNKLKFPACKSAPSQDGGDKQGCLSGLRSCGRREIRSSPLSPSNQLGVQDVHGGCLPKAAHTVGKHFSCFSLLPSVTHDAQRAVVGNPNTTEENGLLEIPKLKFDRVGMSKRHLAYGADDVLDELDYFRIQDELDNTYHAADTHAAGCVQDLVLNARHTARACVNKLKFPACKSAPSQDGGDKQGCLSGLRSCGRREIRSSPLSPSNQLGVQDVHGGCLPKAAHTVGKHFSCFSLLPSVTHDAQRAVVGNPNTTEENGLLEIPKLKFDRVGMSKKILDITEKLKPVCAKVHEILQLEMLNSRRFPPQDIATNRTKTTPQIIEPKLYGRDSHIKVIIDEIVNGECSRLTVLPLVGQGGIGKTTLTTHIYDKMKSHFQVPIWICVSLDFNASRLAKEIVKQTPQVNNENNNCSDEELIEQRIKGKRVLLVLDDVWKHHESEWEKLIALFKREDAKGNMVIITTRIPEVANTVKTTKCPVELDRLCPADTMSFFEECVFGAQTPWVDHRELSEIGSKIVDKLKGSPLAAKTVGRLLRNKLALHHWRSVLESKEWESQTHANDIMPALKLSYDHLPFHLQQCFSYCALFPEDYEFYMEELISLWIGLDILDSCDQTNKIIENVGQCYLDDLVNHGFFKMNKKEDGRPYYVIHDLLHELAVNVSSQECLSIYSSSVRDIQISQSVRHLSIIVNNIDVKDMVSFEDYAGNLSALDKRFKVENLRTLMLFGDHHGSFAKTFGVLFKEARSLRIISLSGVSYDVEDILRNFSKLFHLRYLRIKPVSYWDLCLPNALFRLYHLKVIDLESVHHCVSSTRHMSNLVKLRHFIVSEKMSKFHSDICGVGKLKFIQNLRAFRVGKESEGFELSQLGQLKEIRKLCIYNLEKVQTKEEANELKLIHKNHLRTLTLEWDIIRSNKDPVQEENILGSLVPHSNLEHLRITGHGGTDCPTWLNVDISLKCLESLCLDGVSWKNLPPLGELWMVNDLGEEYQGCTTSDLSFHNLKRLHLSKISGLKKWAGNGTCHLFSRLEVLIVKDCSELIELPFSHSTCSQAQLEEKISWFPRLQELVIEDCPKLASLPPIPWRTGSLLSAEIKRVGSCFEELYYSKHGSKIKLEIAGKGCQSDVFWNGLNFSNLTELKEVYMRNVPPLPLDDLRVLTSLKMINISGSSSIFSMVEGDARALYRFPVEELVINGGDLSGRELTLLLSFLPNLSKLIIRGCENISGLGVGEHAGTVSGEQQQQPTRGEEIITAAAAEGLLLLPSQLQTIFIIQCKKLSILSNPVHDGGHQAAAVGEIREGGLQRLRSLRSLWVTGCPEFLSSYSSSPFLPFPTSLQHLDLRGVRYMEALQALSNLTSLTRLILIGCEGSRDDGIWHLLAHGRLTELMVYDAPDFFSSSDPSCLHDKEVFSRSSKLFDLNTENNTGFLAAPICSLFSSTLTKLILAFTNEVELLTTEQGEALQLLTSLQELQLLNGKKLQCFPAGLNKLMGFKKLWIYECSSINSLPSLPSSLQVLYMFNCGAIKSLPNSLPSSLEILNIRRCDGIKSLPKNGLPSSMRELDVHDRNSEELKRACRELIGTIPIIKA